MSSKSELPITLDIVRSKNLEQLKVLNSVIFPIKYQDKTYQECMDSGAVTQFALHTDVVVGGIAAQLQPQAEGGSKLYIMSLGVLAPYRNSGVGSKLLRHSLKVAEKDPSVREAYLHVQASNTEAQAFYKKFGFELKESVPDYYKKLAEPDAVILSKVLKAAAVSA
ncbi:MAG: hypothetical protein WDW38_002578 [Sanguina aurantia]